LKGKLETYERFRKKPNAAAAQPAQQSRFGTGSNRFGNNS
jgi:hypothetical protein